MERENKVNRIKKTNGTRRFSAVPDQRTLEGKRWTQILNNILSLIDNPTEIDRQSAKRLAGIIIFTEQQEQYLLAGDSKFDGDLYLRAIGKAHAIANTLNLFAVLEGDGSKKYKRRHEPVVDLESYIHSATKPGKKGKSKKKRRGAEAV